METIIKSRWFKIAAGVTGVLVLMLASFASGVSVGIHKARFSENFGKNYERNFMGAGRGQGLPGQGMMNGQGSRGGMMGGLVDKFEGKGLRNAHGLAGVVMSITDNNIVVKDRDNKENTVTVNDQTLIKNGREDWKIADLKTGDQLVIMGTPGDNGVVNATLIRVFVSATK
jgi:hypothetical protein